MKIAYQKPNCTSWSAPSREEACQDWTSGKTEESDTTLVSDTDQDESRSTFEDKVEKAKGFLKRDEPRPRETASSGDFREEEIFIPLRREIADVSKQARVREEVRVNKPWKPSSLRPPKPSEGRKWISIGTIGRIGLTGRIGPTGPTGIPRKVGIQKGLWGHRIFGGSICFSGFLTAQTGPTQSPDC